MPQLEASQRGLPLEELAPLLHSGLGDQVRLPDGRQLAYIEFGDPHGAPCFYFHGAAGALEAAMFAQAAAKHHIRLIALNRPGVGASSPKPGRQFRDWPQDVSDAADALGLNRFGIIGSSGAGAYIYACARFIPGRLTGVASVCGFVPLLSEERPDQMPSVRYMVTLCSRFPRTAGLAYRLTRWYMNRLASQGKAPNLPDASEADREAANVPGLSLTIAKATVGGLSAGPSGLVDDIALYAGDLGFELGDITIPVKLFHGEQDRNVPFVAARRIAKTIPKAELTSYPNGGHLFVGTRTDEIMGQWRSSLQTG